MRPILQSTFPRSVNKSGKHWIVLFLLILSSLAVSLATVRMASRDAANTSLFALTNLVGPTTQSLLDGEGLSTCTDALGTLNNPICFHAARMPVASLVIALGVRLLGDHVLRVDLLKTILLLIPLEFAIYLAWLQLPRCRVRQWIYLLLLILPFGMTAFLADVTNMQVEEGYSYSLLAVAVALLFFALQRAHDRAIPYALLFALAIDGLYLSKSSMAPLGVVLVAGYLLLERRAVARWIVLLLVLAAPVGWAVHQHHASGRYSIGTSLDGINLHKGNNSAFLPHYPPKPGESLDQYDEDLNRGLYFANEWSFNDYHQRSAIEYMRSHPGDVLRGDLRKLDVIFFSVTKYGSSESSGLRAKMETGGLILFRILLWTSIFGSLFWIFRPTEGRTDRRLQRITGGLYLLLIGASSIPYLLGFAYTRHVSILIYPSVLLCCRLLTNEPAQTESTSVE